MNQKKLAIATSMLLASMVFFGCIATDEEISAEEKTRQAQILQKVPEIQKFLDENPRSKIRITTYTKEEIEEYSQEIIEMCEGMIPLNPHYRAEITTPDRKKQLISWIEAKSKESSCSVVKEPAGEEIPPGVSTAPDSPPLQPMMPAQPITPECGNNIIEETEQCDTTNLNNQTCQTRGFDEGTLLCNNDCTFNTTQCTKTMVCGDGTCETGEDSISCPSDCPSPELTEPITPILECIEENAGGTYTSHFGYLNHNDTKATILIGEDNKITGGGTTNTDQGQPTTFETGRTPLYETAGKGAFAVTFNGENLVWTLVSPNRSRYILSVSSSSKKCPTLQPPECGNNKTEQGEQCDGTNLNYQTCQKLEFDTGTLACNEDCTFDTTNCIKCGDSLIDGTEQCDSGNLGGQTCQSKGFDEGTLLCNENCTLNTSQCTKCGNSIIEAAEQCDTTNLNYQTCQTQGFDTGTITCKSDCSFNTTQCSNNPVCGNSVIEGTEQCDSSNLGGQTCQSKGFDTGTITCNPNCTLNTTQCIISPICGNYKIEGTEQCDGTDFGGQTCQSKGFDGGTLICNQDCTTNITQCTICGNSIIEGTEQCDSSNLGGQTCQTQGFETGTLTCSNCAFNTSQCSTCGNSIIEAAEECDGTNLGGETCQTQGFDTGTLTCSNCTFDASQCLNFGCGDGILQAGEECDIVDGTPQFNERCEQIKPGYFEPGYPQAVAGACVDCKVTELGCARLVPIVSLGAPSGTIEVPLNNRMVSFDFTIQQGFYEPGYIIHARKQGETSDFATYPISGYEYLAPGILPTEISGKEIEMGIGNFEWFVEIKEKGTTEVHETSHQNFAVEREVIDGDGICDIGEFTYSHEYRLYDPKVSVLSYAPISPDCPQAGFRGNLFFEGNLATSNPEFLTTTDVIAYDLLGISDYLSIDSTSCNNTSLVQSVQLISNKIMRPIGGYNAVSSLFSPNQGNLLFGLRWHGNDGTCQAGENYLTSSSDCPLSENCPNNFCEPSKGETFINCPFDCPAPSSYTITGIESYKNTNCVYKYGAISEGPQLSLEISCGNGTCELGENYLNCPTDCHP